MWYKYNCNKQKVEGKTKRKKQDSIIILFLEHLKFSCMAVPMVGHQMLREELKKKTHRKKYRNKKATSLTIGLESCLCGVTVTLINKKFEGKK